MTFFAPFLKCTGAKSTDYIEESAGKTTGVPTPPDFFVMHLPQALSQNPSQKSLSSRNGAFSSPAGRQGKARRTTKENPKGLSRSGERFAAGNAVVAVEMDF